jgi:DNA polymerase-3 subunit beta
MDEMCVSFKQEVVMELYCEQEGLAAALKAVLPAVPSRLWATAEAGMLLRADGHLSVIATDREMSIRCQVGAQVTRPGEVVLPARTISDLVALLDPDRVDVSLDEGAQVLALRCGRTLAHVRGWKAEDFPELPIPAGDPVARMEAQVLRDAVGRVAHAASTDMTRATLCCVLMQFREDQVTLVTADGFRLARYTAPLIVPVDEPLDLVVPASGLRQLQRLARKGEVAIFQDGSRRHAIFEVGDVVVGCLLGGKFPEYEGIIPQEWNARAVVGRDALRLACRTARAMHNECGALRLEFAEDKLVITAASVDAGEGRTELEAEVEGEHVEVSLNVRYLADAVAATEGEQVAITADVPAEGTPKPIAVRPLDEVDRQVTVIMPMNR